MGHIIWTISCLELTLKVLELLCSLESGLKQSLIEVQSNFFEALNLTLNHTLHYTLHYTLQISLEVQGTTLSSLDRILTQFPSGSKTNR